MEKQRPWEERKPCLSRIVVMGGSFNPPTIAHYQLLTHALNALQAQKGIFVPSSHAYVERKIRKAEDEESAFVLPEIARLKMLEGMCEDDSRLSVNTSELGTTYPKGHTLKTLDQIQKDHLDAEVYFIFGGDKLAGLPKWGSYEELITKYHIIIFKRDVIDPCFEIMNNPLLAQHQDRFVILDTPVDCEGISSTSIRKLYKAMLHPKALQKIMEVFENA